MKRLTALTLALLLALSLSACKTEETVSADPGFTLSGGDIHYSTLTQTHNDLKAMGLMDPNATVWTAPELTAEDLGEVLGTVGWCEEEGAVGCTVYRWAKFPENAAVCILDWGGKYRLYQEDGTLHPDNGTGLAVEKVELRTLSAPAICRENWTMPEKARELSLDLDGNGQTERVVRYSGNAPVYAIKKLEEEGFPWPCNTLWVVEEQADGSLTAMEFPTAAFAAEITERLKVENTDGNTVLRLEGKVTVPTAYLEAKDAGTGLDVALGYPYIRDYSQAGYLGFTADLQVKTEKTTLTVGTFDGRIGYQGGVFTLGEWELSGFPVD